MGELRSDTITREMLLDPYLDMLVGLAPRSVLSLIGWQVRDAFRITLVDRFRSNENRLESLTRKYTLEDAIEEKAEEGLSSDTGTGT
jgi:hypothetical protein